MTRGSNHVLTQAEIATVLATLMFITFITLAIIYIIVGIFLGRLFKKAGEGSWKAWMPVYNGWTLLKLGNQKGMWALFSLIPVVNIVTVIFMYIAMYHIGLRFEKDKQFVLVGIFFPLVWIIWLAVDTSTWQKKSTISSTKAAIFSVT